MIVIVVVVFRKSRRRNQNGQNLNEIKNNKGDTALQNTYTEPVIPPPRSESPPTIGGGKRLADVRYNKNIDFDPPLPTGRLENDQIQSEYMDMNGTLPTSTYLTSPNKT